MSTTTERKLQDEELTVPGLAISPSTLAGGSEPLSVIYPPEKIAAADVPVAEAITVASIPEPAAPTVPADDDPTVWANARKIYMTYFFAAWGARMWEFAAIVFIMDGLFPSSLMASSLFGLFEAIAGIFGSGPAGHLIDTKGRLSVIRMSIAIQNISVIVAMGFLCTALISGGPEMDFTVRAMFLFVVVALGVSAKFGAMLDKMSINKDWLVVIASGNRNVQSQINASVRRIDMVCQILAPMGVGLGSSFLGPASTCVLVALWAFFSLFVEFRLAGVVYAAIPALALPRKSAAAAAPAPAAAPSSSSLFSRVGAWFATTSASFAAYRAHQCLWVSIPYCMLYVSVLSFGGIMVSYLKTLGCSDDLLSAGRGLAALVAIGPTFAVPYFIPKIGLYVTGRNMLWAQVACLVPIVAGFLLNLQTEGVETKVVETYDQLTKKTITKETTTMPVLFIVLVFFSICLSRFGLWGFDLAQTQMMQELIDKSETGKVNGAQELMLNFCWLFSFALTMIFSDPALFMWPAYVSFALVLGAGVVFTLFGMRIDAAVKEQASFDEKKRLASPGTAPGSPA